jgi:hypothetical protein
LGRKQKSKDEVERTVAEAHSTGVIESYITQARKHAYDETTLSCHKSHWTAWEIACKSIGSDSTIRWDHPNAMELTRDKLRALIFGHYYVKGNLPSNIVGVVSSIKACLSYLYPERAPSDTTADINVLTQVWLRRDIQASVRGLTKIHARANPASRYKRFPFRIEWITIMDKIIRESYDKKSVSFNRAQKNALGNNLKSMMVSLPTLRAQTFIRVAFFFLLRKSEILPGMKLGQDKNGGSLKWSNILFKRANLSIIDANLVANGTD